MVFNANAESTTDFYGTPPSAVDLIVPYLNRVSKIWEPCAGFGAVSDYLRKKGFDVTASDLSTGSDALQWQPGDWDIAVTNPPWSLKTQFLERFFSIGKPFAFLLPSDLVNQKRTALFLQHGIQLVVPNWRVRYFRFDGQTPVEAPSPNTGSAWFCYKLDLPRDLIFVVR